MTAKRLLRLPEVVHHYGLRRAAVYRHVSLGLLPPPVRVGPRCAAWPENEINEVIAARVRGASDADVRTIVKSLVAARANIS
jgi:prophage regulatory protein